MDLPKQRTMCAAIALRFKYRPIVSTSFSVLCLSALLLLYGWSAPSYACANLGFTGVLVGFVILFISVAMVDNDTPAMSAYKRQLDATEATAQDVTGLFYPILSSQRIENMALPRCIGPYHLVMVNFLGRPTTIPINEVALRGHHVNLNALNSYEIRFLDVGVNYRNVTLFETDEPEQIELRPKS